MKRLFVYIIFLLLCMAVENNASAISINIVPSTQTVQNGDAVSADVVISGLTSANEIVSAYELNIGYDASILDATSVTFGSYLDDLSFPGFSLQDYDLSVSGIVNFAELSLLSDADLAAQQLGSFVLATLNFDAIGVGNSTLAFISDPTYGIDVKGRAVNGVPQILALTSGDTSVVVEPSVSVPEPSTILLFVPALSVLGLMRKKARL